ncbi:hypothetical protein [Bartonella sp. CB178]|uniref:hypothetical protein n=1 Tax=Bartonella sp. CB178 TaxID=3112255 RepID=UPI00300E589D
MVGKIGTDVLMLALFAMSVLVILWFNRVCTSHAHLMRGLVIWHSLGLVNF